MTQQHLKKTYNFVKYERAVLWQDSFPPALLLQTLTAHFSKIHYGWSSTEQALTTAFPLPNSTNHPCKPEDVFSVPPHFPLHSSWLWHSPACSHAGNKLSANAKTIPNNGFLQQIRWCLPGMPVETSTVLYRHALQHSCCLRSSQLHFPSLYFSILKTVTCT